MYMLKNDKLLQQKIRDNEIYFGPLSSFITHAATKKPAIDESIICRTLMYNLEKGNGQILQPIYSILQNNACRP